jgi:hypothetical protein
MKCPRCQQDNLPLAKFCLECGVPVDGANPSPKSYADLKGENEDLKGENEGLRRSLGEAHAQVTEALEQQTATAEILRAISSSPTDLQPVLDTIVQSATRVCQAPDAGVLLVEGDGFRVAAHCGPIAAGVGSRFSLTRWTVTGRAILEGRPVQVENLATADDFPEGRITAMRLGHRTTSRCRSSERELR